MASTSRDIFDEIDIDGGDIFDEIGEETLFSPKGTRALNIGAGKALSSFLGTGGNILSLLGAQPQETLPGEEAARGREFDILSKIQEGETPSLGELLMLSEDDVAPRYSRLPTSQDVEEILEVPEAQSGTERFAGRIGEALGGGAALGAGPRSLLSLGGGAAAGQAVRETGGGELPAVATDLLFSVMTMPSAKGLVPNKYQNQLVSKLRNKGFTDQEITPLLASDAKLKGLKTFGEKGKKLTQRLDSTRNKIGKLYEDLRQAGGEFSLRGENYEAFRENLGETLSDIRPRFRRLLEQELNALDSSEHTVKDLVNFYQDINAVVKGEQGGKAVLNLLKKPVIEGISEVSPELADDFVLATNMFKRFSKAAKAGGSSYLDQLVGLGEGMALGNALVTGNPKILSKVVGTVGGRKLAREIAINPKLQNLKTRIAQKLKQNKPQEVRSLVLQTMKTVEKDSSDLFDDLDFDSLVLDVPVEEQNGNNS